MSPTSAFDLSVAEGCHVASPGEFRRRDGTFLLSLADPLPPVPPPGYAPPRPSATPESSTSTSKEERNGDRAGGKGRAMAATPSLDSELLAGTLVDREMQRLEWEKLVEQWPHSEAVRFDVV